MDSLTGRNPVVVAVHAQRAEEAAPAAEAEDPKKADPKADAKADAKKPAAKK